MYRYLLRRLAPSGTAGPVGQVVGRVGAADRDRDRRSAEQSTSLAITRPESTSDFRDPRNCAPPNAGAPAATPTVAADGGA